MSFNDIFKSSFLENITEFSILDTVIGLAAALVIGLFIFVIYRKTLTGVMYSTGFALTLVGLSLVTTLVIMAVTSNVVLSLGMVGALSIVRFRAAIKEPVEIVFLFWSLAVGIVIGAGMIPLAIIGSVLIGLILLLFALLIWRGFVIGVRARDRFGSFIALGLTAQLALQVLLNIAVATNSFPNTGIGLPFFSYGGTSLMMLLGQVGVILSVSRQTKPEDE